MSKSYNHRSPVAIVAIAVCLDLVLLDGQARLNQEKQREQWQRVGDIFQAMGVKDGATVADIGAGDGFFTSRLAAAVGPTGRVYAVDASDSAIDRLRRRLADEGQSNVTIVKGTTTDPKLPAGRIDAALIVNAYHEMAEHQAMLSAIRTALKPAGRLVLVEPVSDSRRAADRAALTREHEITPEFAMQDARAVGLRIIGLEDPFTTRGRSVEWMLTLTPAGAVGPVVVSTSAAASNNAETEDWRDPAIRISADDFIALAKAGGATIIDVRNEEMFAQGHIPDAILIPLDDIDASTGKLRALKHPFVTYCS
jgi:predicted methyltransferase